jgi:KaiC/GvpD/RAD55 family RecA-like ATPase
MANKEARIQTRIAEAKWSVNGDIEAAKISGGSNVHETRHIYWLDELFHGGIVLPPNSSKDPAKPVSVLITGPPGGGKSTLALELCYRIATATEDQIRDKTTVEALGPRPWQLLYVSVDTAANDVIHKAESFFPDAKEWFVSTTPKSELAQTRIAVWGTNRIKEWGPLSKTVDEGLKWAAHLALGADFAKFESEILKSDKVLSRWFTSPIARAAPQVLIIDSLNVLKADQAGEFFQKFLLASKRTRMVIFILDSAEQGRQFWEYACDIVIRLDHTASEEYYVRTLEIVKARGQSHVLGQHQLKIYSKSTADVAHPYCNEGLFIFPSIHYYLSLYKKSLAGPQENINTTQKEDSELADAPKALQNLHRMISGFPQGRCTAFVGSRGGHKSHLGYLYLLDRVMKRNNVGLVISLRDDELTARSTMARIIVQEQLSGKEPAFGDTLEILYYHPGYITPEEFFHKMYLSMLRLKAKGRPITVIFNSLDQLSARFPLCARQQIFVPGIIECLTGERITSVFIGVDEKDQPVEQYGLLPMADLILRFSPDQFTYSDYIATILGSGNSADSHLLSKRGLHETIVVSVVRFAGGRKAGARGILELVDEKTDLNEVPYSQRGLHFTPITSSLSSESLSRAARF